MYGKSASFRNNCVLYFGMNIKELIIISFNLIYISQIRPFTTKYIRKMQRTREINSKISFLILKLYASHFIGSLSKTAMNIIKRIMNPESR